MERIRLGNNIAISWALYDLNGRVHSLEDKEVQLYVSCGGLKQAVTDYTIQGNVVSWVFLGTEQKKVGLYKLILVETDSLSGAQCIDVAEAFRLVSETLSAVETGEVTKNVSVRSVLTYSNLVGVESVDVVESSEDGGTNLVSIRLVDGNVVEIPVKNGSKGDTGATGATGATGPKGDKGDIGERGPAGIDSVEAAIGTNDPTQAPSVDKDLTEGVLSLTFNNIKGQKGDKGDQGNTGSSVDYPYELVNNVTTDDATKGLSAAQGVVLDGKISQLGQQVNYNIASTKILERPGRILPASINNGAWQISTEYHHIVVPVIPGSTIEFITVANGIYYGFLQNYIIPVDGVIPSYVQGYEGRQWTTVPLVIPEGCNYLIIEIGEDITPTSLIINGFELVNGYGQYLMSISKKRALHYFESLETKVYSSFFKNNVSKDYGIKSVSTNFAFTSAVLKQYYNRNVSEGSYSQVFRIDFIVDGTNIDFIHTVLNGSIKSGYDTFTIVRNNKKVTVSLNWQPCEEELSLEFVPDTILHEVVDNPVDNIIADLPTSTDGSDIGVGYAYINAVTGVVTVKLD